MSNATKPDCETELQSCSPHGRALDGHLRDTKWAFLFLLVFTSLYLARPEDTITAMAAMHLPEVTAILAVLCYVGGWLRGRVRFHWTTEVKVILILTVWFIAGIPFSIWRGGSFALLTQTWFKTLVIFLLFSQTVITIDRVRRLLCVILVCEALVAALSIVTSGGQSIEMGERLSGAVLGFLSGNEFGIIAALTMPFLTAFLVTSRSSFKTMLILTGYGTLIAMILLNASRGGVICLLFSFVMILVSGFRKIGKARRMALLLVGMFSFAVIFAPPLFFERIKMIWGNADDDSSGLAESARESSSQRYDVLGRSILFTFRHPLFGVGLGNFPVASGTSSGKSVDWIDPHNTFGQVSSEAGIPALVLYISLLGVAIRRALRIAKTKTVGKEANEIRLLARASMISLLTWALGAWFVSIAYNLVSFYFLIIPLTLERSGGWKVGEQLAPAVAIRTVSY
jgi:hypothetical protein